MASLLFLIVAVLLPSAVILTPVPTSSTETLVLVAKETTEVNNEAYETATQDSTTVQPELKSMHVECNVTNRYSHTVVSSRYKNPADFAQETTFSIILPETAFISGFSMTIKGKTYEAYVKEKEEAKKEYEQAVQSGLSAGYVEQNARDSNKFTVSVNVEPRSKIVFNLTYEELLIRKHGRYEMVINLHPGQLVKDLSVDVNINETQKLVNVRTPGLRSGNEIVEDNEKNVNEYATITPVGTDGKAVHVHFAPSVQQQKDVAKKLQVEEKEEYPSYIGYTPVKENKKKELSLAGQFVIEYDVERNAQGGEILVNDGYFVHFFAPKDLKSLSKHAVFVLDVSGSMSGRKIEQVRQAMIVILEELKPDDYFNLVEFSFGAKVWNFDDISSSPTFEESRKSWWRPPEEVTTPVTPFELPPAFPATADNKKRAKDIIQEMSAGGGTNIYDALKVALNLTAFGLPETAKDKNNNKPQPIIIFLTDGDATDGETNADVILKTVNELNSGGAEAAIFSLAFGYDANKDILKKLSLQNSGFMRQIYEASDAALQLQDFYKQISSPLLANVTFKYPEGQVDSLTKHTFHTLFDGGEFVVAGKMEVAEDNILYVHGLTYDGPIDFPPTIVPIPDRMQTEHEIGPLERLWAYMTIRQLLDKRDVLAAVDANNTKVEDMKKQAIKLALKYSFVTPVTSLVVVKPNETEKVNAEEAASQQEEPSYGVGFSGQRAYALPIAALGGISTPLTAGGFGGGFAGAYYDSPPGAPSYKISSFDSDGILEETEEASEVYKESTNTNETEINDDLSKLSWFQTHHIRPNHIDIEGKDYLIGNNETQLEDKPCSVKSLSLNGTCTVLSACPQVHDKLQSFDLYVKEYFCQIPPTYAGVCCVDLNEKP